MKFEFTREEAGEVYNSLVEFKKFLYELLVKQANGGDLDGVEETCKRIRAVGKVHDKVGEQIDL